MNSRGIEPKKGARLAKALRLSMTRQNDNCCLLHLDHQNEVEPDTREIVCEMCKTALNSNEDGTTDLM
jgi:hypothetical protein